MQYFAQFPIVDYKGVDLVDITRRVIFFVQIASNNFMANDYKVQEGETPQSLANDFYSDPNLDWVIMSCNNILNPFYDWPFNQEQMNEWLVDKYDNPDAIYLYVLPDGRQFFADQRASLSAQGVLQSASTYTYRDFQEAINNAKRNIRVIQPSQMSAALNQYHNYLNS